MRHVTYVIVGKIQIDALYILIKDLQIYSKILTELQGQQMNNLISQLLLGQNSNVRTVLES